MQEYSDLAAVIAISVSLVHSILGEKLIFNRLREGSLVPTLSGPQLRERHLRIVWATWHIVSIFGVGFAVLLMYGLESVDIRAFFLNTVAVCMAISAALVLCATRAKHPGWVGLLLLALACYVA